EVVPAVRGVVGELAESFTRALELATKRAVGAGALVLECVRVEDVNRREDRNHADDEDTDQELEQGASRDRARSTATPAAGRRLTVARIRRRGRRRHLPGLSTPAPAALSLGRGWGVELKVGVSGARLGGAAARRGPDHRRRTVFD